jgi:hypothetical protein
MAKLNPCCSQYTQKFKIGKNKPRSKSIVYLIKIGGWGGIMGASPHDAVGINPPPLLVFVNKNKK